MQDNQVSILANILDTFDIDDVRHLLENQITNNDDYTGPKVDQFHPFYYSYTKVLEMENIDPDQEDDVDEIKNRFFTICKIIIELVSDKFNFNIDNEWLDSSRRLLPSIAVSIYEFFILSIYENIYNLLLNYIDKNKSLIIAEFQEKGTSKDISTIVYKKQLTMDDAIICANIYDICDYILFTLDESDISTYIDINTNMSFRMINKLQELGHVESSYIRTIGDLIKDNVQLRSRLAFEIVTHITNTEGEMPND